MLTAAIIGVVSYVWGDRLMSRVIGEPLEYKSVPGPYSTGVELPTGVFAKAQLDGKTLRVVIGSTFRNSGSLNEPYLTVDSMGHGTVHIGSKPEIQDFFSTCEDSRTFEVKIPYESWRGLKSLLVKNPDTVYESAQGLVALDATKMQELHRAVSEKSFASLVTVHGGYG